MNKRDNREKEKIKKKKKKERDSQIIGYRRYKDKEREVKVYM